MSNRMAKVAFVLWAVVAVGGVGVLIYREGQSRAAMLWDVTVAVPGGQFQTVTVKGEVPRVRDNGCAELRDGTTFCNVVVVVPHVPKAPEAAPTAPPDTTASPAPARSGR